MQNAASVSANAYAGMASSIVGSLQQAFSKSKAVAIAVALVNTYEAFTKALAAYPPPFNYVAAAAALAAGMAQVANIRKTTKDSSSSSGGTSSSSGASTTATAAAQPQSTQGIYVNLEGEKFGREQIRSLIDQINNAQSDGHRIQVVAA
jgi:hypothetical protein